MSDFASTTKATKKPRQQVTEKKSRDVEQLEYTGNNIIIPEKQGEKPVVQESDSGIDVADEEDAEREHVDDPDEKLAVANEDVLFAGKAEHDDDDDDSSVEQENDGDKKEKKKIEKIFDIQNFTHAELGHVMSQEEQNATPAEIERLKDIEMFVEDWRHTVTVRCQRAGGYKEWPLRNGCEFTPAARYTLHKVGVEGIMAMSLRHLTLKRQEVLGRGRRRPFGLADVHDLPALEVDQQYEQVTYIDLVEDHIEGHSLYTGSATGQQGAAQRWNDYDRAKRNGHAQKHEAKSAHIRALVRPSATVHLRPLMIFDRSVPSTHVEIMEGLMMDFLETIDRSSVREVLVKGGYLIHNADILERSKEAFPPRRLSLQCRGLNQVSALKQVKFAMLKKPCAGCGTSDKGARSRAIYLGYKPLMICNACRQSWVQAIRSYEIVGTPIEGWNEFRQVRAGTTKLACSGLFRARQRCQHCDRGLTRGQRDNHEKQGSQNPDSTRRCRYCKNILKTESKRREHEKACNNNPEPNSTEASTGKQTDVQGSIQKATDQDPEKKQFPCQHCQKPLATTAGRRNHENICSENKNPVTLPCQFCQTPYGSRSTRTRHEKKCASKPTVSPTVQNGSTTNAGCTEPAQQVANDHTVSRGMTDPGCVEPAQ